MDDHFETPLANLEKISNQPDWPFHLKNLKWTGGSDLRGTIIEDSKYPFELLESIGSKLNE